MEELSAVGEQVFDAECILNKRLRKSSHIVAVNPPSMNILPVNQTRYSPPICTIHPPCVSDCFCPHSRQIEN
ncbi:hypothetical protein JZ751_013083 [Albula glossodonta]|uniref:Uncharacterized protein n=1 Tax=Albula glossodonta TaxID=121402 RepID=A0A8T2NTN0_9TELE|nr:hypothetical protein JZ751_013083 [Albula glossodonta]